MGYTVSTPCKSAKALRTTMRFLRRHYRPWSVLSHDKYDCTRGPLTKGMAYDHGKCRIGFDYNASFEESDYIFGICRFMALRVGRLGRWEDFHDPAPYIVYDGKERFPVLDRTEWEHIPKQWRWAKVHPWGGPLSTATGDFLKALPASEVKLRELVRSRMALIQDELKRLAALWEG